MKQDNRQNRTTVKGRVIEFLADGRWHSLQEIQDNVRGSSVRSRLQDIMTEDRHDLSGRQKLSVDRKYMEIWRTVHDDDGKQIAKFKLYRLKKKQAQITFDFGEGGR